MFSDDSYKCVFFICVNKEGDIEFEFNWGKSNQEIKIFANLIVALTNNGLNDIIIKNMKEACVSDPDLKKKFDIFHKTYKNSLSKIENYIDISDSGGDLVIDPTQVEI
jgi:hypothetical protein